MDSEGPGLLIGILTGIGLSAACGFRVFVPLLVVSIAGKTGHLHLAQSWQWLASTTAIVTFSVATVLEIGAYFIPWLDNLLDTIMTPAALAAGTIIMVSAGGDLHPVFKWGLAIIGGGSAGLVQLGTVAVRTLSTATTGGTANSAVSGSEAVGAIGLSLLAVLIPIIAFLLVIIVLVIAVRFMLKWVRRWRSGSSRAAVPTTAFRAPDGGYDI